METYSIPELPAPVLLLCCIYSRKHGSLSWHEASRAWSAASFASSMVVGSGVISFGHVFLGWYLAVSGSDMMFFEQRQTRHMISTWKQKHGSQLPFSNLIVLFGLKEKKKGEIWPSRVNRAGRATGSVVSIAHWQGLIRCHTHTVSSWETAGLTEPFDTKIWKGLTNYWGKGWLGGGGCHSSSLELSDAQMLFLTLDVDRLHEVTDISSVYYGTNCDFINNSHVSQI